MRKENTLFSKVVNYINSVGLGETYKVSDMLEDTSPGAKRLRGKCAMKDPFYRNRSYQTMLKNSGFIKNVARGEWKVIAYVPYWFNVRHAQILSGWVGTTEDCYQILNNITAEPPVIVKPEYRILESQVSDSLAKLSAKKKKKKKATKMSASYNMLCEKLDSIHHDMLVINSNLQELIDIYK